MCVCVFLLWCLTLLKSYNNVCWCIIARQPLLKMLLLLYIAMAAPGRSAPARRPVGAKRRFQASSVSGLTAIKRRGQLSKESS